ncbi:Mur ligase domain-containing protein [Rhodococcus rhodochrous]|uniref:Mur ligase domain-containing protein n=1 Tax=Rhodococcus rhodochrous TaxID=1829 RepID=UPI0020B1543A|nr:Mur ligase domain-containing protein [Rhodococcus rhodochrous]
MRSGPQGGHDRVITGISDDSRAVRPGDLYVALPGHHAHGLEFEAEAATHGAVAVLSDRPSRLLPTFVVDRPREVVGPLASWILGHPPTTCRSTASPAPTARRARPISSTPHSRPPAW